MQPLAAPALLLCVGDTVRHQKHCDTISSHRAHGTILLKWLRFSELRCRVLHIRRTIEAGAARHMHVATDVASAERRASD